MICSNCGERISKGIDIGHHWNLSEDLAFACSESVLKNPLRIGCQRIRQLSPKINLRKKINKLLTFVITCGII